MVAGALAPFPRRERMGPLSPDRHLLAAAVGTEVAAELILHRRASWLAWTLRLVVAGGAPASCYTARLTFPIRQGRRRWTPGETWLIFGLLAALACRSDVGYSTAKPPGIRVDRPC